MMRTPRQREHLRDGEEGQVMVLGALALLVVVLAMFSTLAVTHAVHERIRLQNDADAQAFSSAVNVARAYNIMALANRGIVSSMVGAMAMHAYHSEVSAAAKAYEAAGMAWGLIAVEEIAHACSCQPGCCNVTGWTHVAQDGTTAFKFWQDSSQMENKVKDLDPKFRSAIEAFDNHAAGLFEVIVAAEGDVTNEMVGSGSSTAAEIDRLYHGGQDVATANPGVLKALNVASARKPLQSLSDSSQQKDHDYKVMSEAINAARSDWLKNHSELGSFNAAGAGAAAAAAATAGQASKNAVDAQKAADLAQNKADAADAKENADCMTPTSSACSAAKAAATKAQAELKKAKNEAAVAQAAANAAAAAASGYANTAAAAVPSAATINAFLFPLISTTLPSKQTGTYGVVPMGGHAALSDSATNTSPSSGTKKSTIVTGDSRLLLVVNDGPNHNEGWTGIGVMPLSNSAVVATAKKGHEHFSDAHDGTAHDRELSLNMENPGPAVGTHGFAEYNLSDENQPDRGNLYNQPRLSVYLTQDLNDNDGNTAQPWRITGDGNMTLNLPGGTANLNLAPTRTGAAISQSMVYYHRRGDWKEPPSFFSPYWFAKLQPWKSETEAAASLSAGGDTESVIAATMATPKWQ